MDNFAMLKRAKELVVQYFNEHVDKTDNKKITKDFYKGLKMEWDKTELQEGYK